MDKDIIRDTTVFLADVRPLADKSVFARFFPTVNAERQCDINSKRFDEDKVLSLAGGILLDRLLKTWDIRAQIAHDGKGRPYVCGRPDISVSLSHAYPYAAAVISQKPCAIDIEDRARELKAVAERYFSPGERTYAASDAALRTDIWCRKECMVKLLGGGNVRRMDTFALPDGYGYHSAAVQGFSCQILAADGPIRICRIDLSEDA